MWKNNETSDVCIAQDKAARLEREVIRAACIAAAVADGFTVGERGPANGNIGEKVAEIHEFGCWRFIASVQLTDAWGGVRGNARNVAGIKELAKQVTAWPTEFKGDAWSAVWVEV